MEGINKTQQVSSVETQEVKTSPQNAAEQLLYVTFEKQMSAAEVERRVVANNNVERTSERI